MAEKVFVALLVTPKVAQEIKDKYGTIGFAHAAPVDPVRLEQPEYARAIGAAAGLAVRGKFASRRRPSPRLSRISAV